MFHKDFLLKVEGIHKIYSWQAGRAIKVGGELVWI